jgi:hypothetical protein
MPRFTAPEAQAEPRQRKWRGFGERMVECGRMMKLLVNLAVGIDGGQEAIAREMMVNREVARALVIGCLLVGSLRG